VGLAARQLNQVATLWTMTSAPASSDDGFEVVVSPGGTLTVPAAELARHGVRPGAHLRLVPAQPMPERKSVRGALAGTVRREAVEALIQGLDEAKAERAAYYTDTGRHV
jgi:hypothetical protein